MARSIERIVLFKDDADWQYFQNKLAESIKKTNLHCYGWVLIFNHKEYRMSRSKKHIVGQDPLNGHLVVFFNRRHTMVKMLM